MGEVTREREAPLSGVPLLIALVPLTLMGAVLGILSAFLVPVGFVLGRGAVPSGSDAATPPPGGTSALRLLAAADGGGGGFPVSLGIGIAFAGCLALGALARVCTGERISALAPITGWIVIALMANMKIRGDLVLPSTIEPGVFFLYAGVVGGCLGLLPRSLLPRALFERFRPGRLRTTTTAP